MITDVHEINERSQTLKISMYFALKWHEPRLRTNKSSIAWISEDYISTSMLNSKYFWYPDIDVHGVQKSSRQLFMNDLYGMLIYKRQEILYSLRSDITLSCPMDFNRYPFDYQICPFRVSAYFEGDEIVNCTCTVDLQYMDELATTLQYTIEIVELPARYRKRTSLGRDSTRCGFAVVYKRSKTQLFFQVYLTAVMLVIVSWASFLIDPNIVPGRMGLLVTLLLVLVNVFNGFKNSSPPSINLNALDVYLIICICHVFCVLVEYAILLFLGNSNIRNSPAHENQMHPTTDEGNQINGERQLHQLISTFDSFSLIMFPLFFISCLVIYVVYYSQA